jgi:hypothetical protein
MVEFKDSNERNWKQRVELTIDDERRLLQQSEINTQQNITYNDDLKY